MRCSIWGALSTPPLNRMAGVQKGGAVDLLAVQAVNLGQRIDLAAQKGRQMARDGRILRIGQAQLRERRARGSWACR
jgi:hypothetical protein